MSKREPRTTQRSKTERPPLDNQVCELNFIFRLCNGFRNVMHTLVRPPCLKRGATAFGSTSNCAPRLSASVISCGCKTSRINIPRATANISSDNSLGVKPPARVFAFRRARNQIGHAVHRGLQNVAHQVGDLRDCETLPRKDRPQRPKAFWANFRSNAR